MRFEALRREALRRAPLLWAMVALVLGSPFGCATVSPFNQDFHEVRTAHFHIISSFGEAETRELARSLEFFRTGAMNALSASEGWKDTERTRVFAFDGRSMERPFALDGAPSYFLPEPEGGILVMRAPGSWNRRASREVLHRYAHRLLRSQAPVRFPLWLEEGLAQLAGSVDVRGPKVRVGRTIPIYVSLIQDWKRKTFASVLHDTDLSDMKPGEREYFNARCWALVHMLRFGPEDGAETLSDAMAAFEGGRAREVTEANARLAADSEALAREVYEHFSAKKSRFAVFQPLGWDSDALEVRAMSRDRSRSALGRLALSLGRDRLAENYFERALKAKADSAEAHVGLFRATVDDSEDFDARLAAAKEYAGEASRLHVLLGDALLEAARSAEEPESRDVLIGEARERYRKALSLAPRDVEARVGMAESYLLPGGEAGAGLEWMRAAAALRPGSLGIELGLARFDRAEGRRTAARYRARDVASRSHHRAYLETAMELLE